MDSTLLKGLTLLEVIVAEGQPVGITELARRMELPKSNIHRSISALREAGYIDFDADSRRYYPSLKLAQMGRRVSAGFPFRNAVLPVLKRLVDETGESAHFALLDGNGVVFVANVLPPKPVASVVPEGLALPWEDTALGVALVSALSKDERDRLLAANTSSAEHVARAAQDGFALIRRHETRRIFELAVPVQSEWGTVIGAIGMTGPAMRFSEDRLTDQIAAVQRAAQEAFEPEGLSHARDGG